MKHRTQILAVLSGLLVAAVGLSMIGANAADEGAAEQRTKADKTFNDGNFKDAYAIYRDLLLDTDAARPQDAAMAVNALNRLDRVDEIDALLEAAVEKHPTNWAMLEAIATQFRNTQHYGFIVAGEFQRGRHRGGGRYANSFKRDRARGLQLLEQARLLLEEDDTTPAKRRAQFYVGFSEVLSANRNTSEAWRLQYLTDFAELPDVEDGNYYGGGAGGAPVAEDGTPVFHQIPKSYEAAATDGERWRWMLLQAVELDPALTNQLDMDYADFLFNQFGVQTMRAYGSYFGRWESPKTDDEDTSGVFELHTLGTGETIARLAGGVQRFALPDEHNFIKIYKRVADREKSTYAERALEQMAQLFENRRQYKIATAYWKRLIADYGAGNNNYRQDRLNQIVDNWCQFDPMATQAAGVKATVDIRYRNGDTIDLQAHRIDVPKLLGDLKDYLKSNPNRLDWQQVQIGQIGHRLVTQNQTQYITEKVAQWTEKVEPAPDHFDRRVTLETPLEKAGAYLLTATMKNGNTSRIIVWLNDTVILRKQLDGKIFYFVADAVTGKPVPKATVEFFGYRQEHLGKNILPTRQYNTVITQFAEFTDADGQVIPDPKDLTHNFSYLITATNADGRFAYMGFQGVWYGQQHDAVYNATKVFTITDRPVYRPAQSVKFKFWVRHAQYDKEDVSQFANQQFTVQIIDPRNEKVFEKTIKADAYGGLDDEFALPKDATLGVYRLHIVNHGGSSFRVEEYKKPEFEVTVDAPTEPTMLGEKITATIKAKYYFGSPVVNARVKYKILRSNYSANWYPVGIWDWFYGRGYWWFGYDYAWYPGWSSWGCSAPHWWWWPTQHTPPEVVAENEVPVGPDGTVEVEIDTALAKAMHGDTDHRYEITAEVTDESRRTIVGHGEVLVARKPFKVYTWVDRGHYRTGEVIHASFQAQTLDSRPVAGKGALVLYKIQYDEDHKPIEKAVQEWNLNTNDEGNAELQMMASEAGQYRLSYTVTDQADHRIEGGYVFMVRGEGSDGKDYRFNEIELVPDKREYAPGDVVELMINTDRPNSTVLLFVRPANGVYLPPKIIRLEGQSAVEEIPVTKKDMPNFFVEALTISNGRIYTANREIVVPPEKRVLNVDLLPSKEEYKPGEKASIKIKLTDFFGKPFTGSTVVTIYDKSVEYISGGSNVPAIQAFFWQWRRRHNPSTQSSLDRWFNELLKQGEKTLQSLGVFGATIADEFDSDKAGAVGFGGAVQEGGGMAKSMYRQNAIGGHMLQASAPMAGEMLADAAGADRKAMPAGDGAAQPPLAAAAVRTAFADTALWVGTLETDAKGEADVSLTMPENLTGWKVRTWAMGHGTKVGEGTAEVVTKKNLMLRLQAPRFFIEKDEVVLSANIHNYLDTDKTVTAILELDGETLEPMQDATQRITVKSQGEKRVDWRVKAVREGEAVIRMKALTDEESDAMEMRFPVYVHGMMKMVSYSGVIRPEGDKATITLQVPQERRLNESRLELRYSPTLAGAMVDALPYLVSYPYGSTDQTLNRFVPTVITQKIILDMGVDLEDVRRKQTNLNAQELGEAGERAAQWQRWEHNPVFDQDKVRDMVKEGVKRLTAMQLSDGGWGWFSGWGEQSYPHTTAVVVHGLLQARANDVAIVPGVVDRGIEWLKAYQKRQIELLTNAEDEKKPAKHRADHLDALVYFVLAEVDFLEPAMMDYLYRDRNDLSVYAKACFGLALHRQKQVDKLAMIKQNIEQYLVEDDENQTAFLKLPNNGYWWYWYGSEMEAHAAYLKLLAATEPTSEKAAGLVKYILNNRKHATYWNSTRDTAYCIEALADYIRASGEDKPDMTIEILVDGVKRKEVAINAQNLFTFDGSFILQGDAVETGEHTVEIRRRGKGPVYFNAYLSYFSLEDMITKAGLEVKVNRAYYKLVPVDKTIKVSGARGQALDQKVEKYQRQPLKNLAQLKSGDLVEIELEIDSKNDYEYLIFEDMKAAGFEPVEVRSGYNSNDMGAYMELRDNRVAFFVRWLARGKHSVSYRMRAEIPGRFSALPARAYAVYAPELKGNSDEIKLIIKDTPTPAAER